MVERDVAPVASIARVKDLLAVFAGVLKSVTCTVNKNVPDAVGVPEIVPLEAFKLSPAGGDPEPIDHV